MTEALQQQPPVSVESQTTRQDVPRASTSADDSDAAVILKLATHHFERLRLRADDHVDIYDSPDDTGYEDMAPARRITNGPLFTYDLVAAACTRVSFERAIPRLPSQIVETSESFKAAQSMAIQYVTAPGTSWRNAGPMDSQAWMAYMAGTRPDMADLTKSWLAWPLAKAYIGRLTLTDIHPFLTNWINYYTRSNLVAHWANYRLSVQSPSFQVGFLTPAEYAAVQAGNRVLPERWRDALAIPFPSQFSADDTLAAWVQACVSTVTPRLVISDAVTQDPDLIINAVYFDERSPSIPGGRIILVDIGQYAHGNQNVLANEFAARVIPANAANSHAFDRVAHYLEERAVYREKLSGMLIASFVFNRYVDSALLLWMKVVVPDLSYLFARFSPVNVIVDPFDASHAPRLLPFTMFRVANFAVELALMRAYAYDEVRRGEYVTRQDYRCAVAAANSFNALMGQFGIAFGELITTRSFVPHAAIITSPLAWFEETSLPLGVPDFHSLVPTRSALIGAGWHYRRGKRVENPLDRATQRAFAWAAMAAWNDVYLNNAVINRWDGHQYGMLPVSGFIPVNDACAFDLHGCCRPRPVIVPLSATVVEAEEETLNNGLDVIVSMTNASYQASLVSTFDGRPGTTYNRFVTVAADPSDDRTQLLPTDGNYDFLGS